MFIHVVNLIIKFWLGVGTIELIYIDWAMTEAFWQTQPRDSHL